MLFNSYIFIFIFLPIVFAGFFIIGKYSCEMSALWLLLASLFFYSWWNPIYVGLLLASIVFNYGIGISLTWARSLGRVRWAKWILWSGITADLCLLGGYKYSNFFVESVDSLMDLGWHLETIILPLGISFFTFTQIAFLVDAFRGEVKESNFLHYALFVSYFPHLIAGPILHHKQMMPQFALYSVYRPNIHWIGSGMAIFTLGLAKKVLLADELAGYAIPIFDAPGAGISPNAWATWLGVLSYSLQIYFDFSGYSDMAIGLSRLFGIELPINFNSPYKAASVIDFWRCWHMTLSKFLRDYLYVPLGGNRKGPHRRYLNLLLTMLLGGLWHGANWTFVIWGSLHGLYLILNHWLQHIYPTAKRTGFSPRYVIGVAITFFSTVVAWVFFRAESVTVAMQLLSAMCGFSSPGAIDFHSVAPNKDVNGAMGAIAVGFVIIWLFPNSQQLCPVPSTTQTNQEKPLIRDWFKAVALGTLFGLTVSKFGQVSQFLYFQF